MRLPRYLYSVYRTWLYDRKLYDAFREISVPFSKLNAHMNDLLHRFKNSYLKRHRYRVARDPMRKLQPSDRLNDRCCKKL